MSRFIDQTSTDFYPGVGVAPRGQGNTLAHLVLRSGHSELFPDIISPCFGYLLCMAKFFIDYKSNRHKKLWNVHFSRYIFKREVPKLELSKNIWHYFFCMIRVSLEITLKWELLSNNLFLSNIWFHHLTFFQKTYLLRW